MAYRMLITVAEAARRLGLPRSTVYGYAVGLDRFRVMKQNEDYTQPYIDFAELLDQIAEKKALTE